eukprot:SAG22_NODE_9147_length_607_cov_1.435039_2_plen_88_part_01
MTVGYRAWTLLRFGPSLVPSSVSHRPEWATCRNMLTSRSTTSICAAMSRAASFHQPSRFWNVKMATSRQLTVGISIFEPVGPQGNAPS